MTAPVAEPRELLTDVRVPRVAHCFPPEARIALCGVRRVSDDPRCADSVRCRTCMRMAETHGRSLTDR